MIEDDIDQMFFTNKFEKTVIRAVRDNNHKKIKKIILSNAYPDITKEEKEKQIFNLCVGLLLIDTVEESLFEYLIFDYNIREDVYSCIDSKFKNQLIDDMFNNRRLNQELNKELPINSENNKRKKI
jgi:hypothetical protein